MRLPAISLHGQIGDAASQRGIVISDIDEKLDLNDLQVQGRCPQNVMLSHEGQRIVLPHQQRFS